MCIKQNLGVKQLIEKIKSNEYERLEYKENIELITEENNTLVLKYCSDERIYSTTYMLT